MTMDSAREQSHPQEIGSQTLESMVANSKAQQEKEKKKPRPADNSLKCPRCESSNTKFCYYNNYSLSQPRYFCKSCRRYWTKGGTLRNVPVGGGCRKNKRSSSSSRRHNLDHPITPLNPPSYDLELQKPTPGHVGLDDPWMNGGDFGLIEALRGGFLEIPRGFHDLCGGNGFGMECGSGLGTGMGMGMGMGVWNQEMGLMDFGSDAVAAPVKQETRNGDRPWQNVGGEDLDFNRIGGWNGIGSGSSTWPLMI